MVFAHTRNLGRSLSKKNQRFYISISIFIFSLTNYIVGN